jgi:hypothetical protein
MMDPSLPCPTRSGVRRRLAALFMAGLLAGGLSPFAAQAQDLPLPEPGYVNEFARPGQPTMTLYLWGAVGTTGIWRVERDVDLIQLLSVASVPGVGTAEGDVRRRFVLHIYRDEGGERREIYAEEVENLIGGGGAPAPALQDGDILAIETRERRRISLDLVFTTLRTVSSFLSVYLLLRREF